MKTMVAGAPSIADCLRLGPVGTTRCAPSCRKQSGHLCPTAASIEHEDQIGLPHLLQLSKVLRSGWR
jgi:hypothetical protein